MTEPALVSRRRIVVALDASAQSRAALEAAARLAGILDAELSGIFVEDADLLRLAQLPFAREAVPGLPSRRVADAAAMERTLRNLAEQARAALEELPGRYGVSCDFRIARGHVLTELLAAASGADIVAIGVRGRLTQWRWRLGSTARGVLAEANCSLLMIRTGESLGTPVVVLYDNTPGAERALHAADDLVRPGSGRLVIVVSADVGSLASLQARAQQTLGPGVDAEFHSLDPSQLKGLEPLLRLTGCGVLVLSHQSSLLGGDIGESVLAHLRCPVLAVR